MQQGQGTYTDAAGCRSISVRYWTCCTSSISDMSFLHHFGNGPERTQCSPPFLPPTSVLEMRFVFGTYAK
eukprot:scaffold17078_cov26-Tisochrysis_lutea.AAC.1